MKTEENATRAMIEFAVDKGIREVAADPKRSLRNLADIGSRFSTCRFHQDVFSVVQLLLEDEESAYYPLFENLLQNTDHEMLKKYILNMGYNSWTVQARTLRKEIDAAGHPLPWIILFHYSPDVPDGMTCAQIDALIAGVKRYGINTFCIFAEGASFTDDSLPQLFERHEDAGFLVFLSGAVLNAEQILALKRCGNALVSVRHTADDARETCGKLRNAKLLYAVHDICSPEQLSMEYIDAKAVGFLSFGAGMAFFLPVPGAKKAVSRLVRETRLQPRHQLLMWDLYNDIRMIGDTLCDNGTWMEFSSDGSLLYPEGTPLRVTDPPEILFGAAQESA